MLPAVARKAGLPNGNDEGLGVVDYKLHQPTRNALHGVLRERAHSADAVLFHDLLTAGEDRRAGQGKIQNLRNGNPRFLAAHPYLDAVRRSMCRLRPYDFLPIAAGNQEKPFADRRRSVVAGTQQPVLHMIAQLLKLAHKAPEGFALIARIGSVLLVQSAPILELLHVFQHDYAGFHGLCPLHSHPREAANLLADRLSALGLGVMLAVRREPGESDRATGASLHRVNLPHVLGVMLRRRVVCAVHGDGCRIVVDGNIHAAAYGDLNAGGSAAATGKVIYYDLIHRTGPLPFSI